MRRRNQAPTTLTPSPRRAFTLVELLVVIAIIALLVALLLPAMQVVRESTRRTACSSRLRDVGIALQAFYSTHDHYPVGADSKPDPLDPNTPHNFYRWSALAYLTPYLEEQKAHDLINFDTPMYRNNRLNPEVSTAVSTKIATFLCPSDLPWTPVSDAGGVLYGPTNYVVCAGSGRDGGSPFNADGVFFVNSKITTAEITDGVSHTILVSESTLGVGKESMGLGDRDSVNAQTDYATPLLFGANATLTEDRCLSPQGWNIASRRGFFWASGEYRCALYNHHRVPNDPVIDCIGSRATSFEDIATRFAAHGWRAARSRHPGGVNALFGDGSVQFIDEGVDASLWRAASTRFGNESERIQ